LNIVKSAEGDYSLRSELLFYILEKERLRKLFISGNVILWAEPGEKCQYKGQLIKVIDTGFQSRIITLFTLKRRTWYRGAVFILQRRITLRQY